MSKALRQDAKSLLTWMRKECPFLQCPDFVAAKGLTLSERNLCVMLISYFKHHETKYKHVDGHIDRFVCGAPDSGRECKFCLYFFKTEPESWHLSMNSHLTCMECTCAHTVRVPIICLERICFPHYIALWANLSKIDFEQSLPKLWKSFINDIKDTKKRVKYRTFCRAMKKLKAQRKREQHIEVEGASTDGSKTTTTTTASLFGTSDGSFSHQTNILPGPSLPDEESFTPSSRSISCERDPVSSPLLEELAPPEFDDQSSQFLFGEPDGNCQSQ